MPGNGESKLCVKESKLYSWNCCWCLLCEGPREVPPALCSLSQCRCECKWGRVKSREPAMGLCCVPLAQALLPGGRCYRGGVKHWVRCWPQLSPMCPNGRLERRQVSLPSQALGWQCGSATIRFSSFCHGASPCREGETRCQPCPSLQGDARSCSISCPCLGRCP